MVHALKTLPEYYCAVITGRKLFEVRKNDRNFKVGDYVALNELDDTRTEYTGRSTLLKIIYILSDENYCKKGFIIMGLAPCSVREVEQYAFEEMETDE